MRSVPALLLLLLLGVSCWTPVPSSPPAPVQDQTRVQPDPSLTLPASAGWYKDQVFYHVWLKAFHDSNGDGVGDLAGVTQKLDYLQNLGVTALWLSPFLANASSTSNLHGYDVTDHYRVDPRFGSLVDVKALLAAAHVRGMRVIFDFVPNHVSTQHPWFQDSIAGRNNKREWFVWRPVPPTQGWQSFGGGPGSGFHRASNGLYYYGVFWEGMPDLNYRNPAVSSAMSDVVTYWLNQGFDGLRVDAVKYLFENDSTGENADQPETLAWFQDLRANVLDAYEALGDAKFMVAENWTGEPTSLRAYLRSGGRNGFQATLDFPQGQSIFDVLNGGQSPAVLQTLYDSWVSGAIADGGWSMSFLNNHDNYLSRPRTSFGSDQKMRVAQALQMTAWGTPILYYGNEIGMTGLVGSDVNLRTDFDWTKVAAAEAAPDSLFQWQRTLDLLRAARASLRRGDYSVLPSTAGTVAVLRTLGGETTLMVANLSAATAGSVTVNLAGIPVAAVPTTLVGDGTLSLTSGLGTLSGLLGFGVRVYALEGTGTKLRGDFTDGPPPSVVWAYAKDGSAAGLSVAFYDASGTLLSQPTTAWSSNGLWYASASYPGNATSGYVQWSKASSSYQSGLLPFSISVPGQDTAANVPPFNTGNSSTWYLRGIGGNWNTGVALALDGTGAGHFVAVLSPSQAPATGVTFKINASATAWDYFFGFGDLLYDTSLGNDPATLGFASAGGTDRNFSFVPDGTSSYEVHFWNDLGSCRIGIKKVVP